jgi:hypothetical protein
VTPKRAVPKTRRPRPSTLERAVIASVRSADWIAETDEASVWILRDLALALDSTRGASLFEGFGFPARDISELAGRASHLLRELGLTPAARYRLGLWEVAADDPLAEILRIADASDRDAAES